MQIPSPRKWRQLNEDTGQRLTRTFELPAEAVRLFKEKVVCGPMQSTFAKLVVS